MEPTTLQAQQAAIQEVRTRYERGELSIEEFKRALDALVLAEDADECQAILAALPRSPAAPLAALEQPRALTPAPTPETPHKRIVAFMSQTKKLRRPWRLMPSTHIVAVMGEAQFDLNLADLPPRAKIQVTAVMGEVKLYVPPSTRVTVRSTVLLGEVDALGESTGGVITSGHEQHEPADGTPRAELEIDLFVLMGEVKVVVAEGPTISISELVRNALRAAAEGMQRGLQGTSPRPVLGSGREPPRLPGAPETSRREG